MKKRELEDWEKAECAALKAAIDAFNEGKARKDRVGQGQIADALGINQGSVSAFLSGINPLNARFAAVVSRAIGQPVESFSPRIAAEILEYRKALLAADIDQSALAHHADSLAAIASPRSRSVLERIAEAARAGSLNEDDLELLERISARFQRPLVNEENKPHSRLRNKLKKDDSLPKR